MAAKRSTKNWHYQKTPKSYFGVGFGLLVLYCDRNMNKDNLRESLKDLNRSENFYEIHNKKWNTDKKDPHYTLTLYHFGKK